MDPNPLLLSELRKKKADLLRAKTLRESYGLNFYRPHAKQHRFHEMAHVNGRYCRFGNRGGKTVCGSAEDAAMCIGARTWYKSPFDILGTRPKDDDYETYVVGHHAGTANHPLVTHGIPQRPVRGVLVVVDWDKAKEIFTNQTGSYETRGELFRLIPSEAISKVHISRGGHIDQIDIKRLPEAGGGVSTLRIETVESFKHSKLSVESGKYDFAHFDEPPPREMFNGLASRGLADLNGKFWINATPITEMWINDEFAPSSGLRSAIVSNGLLFEKGKGVTRFIISATIYDNPHINRQGRNNFEATLNAEERECRMLGVPLHLAGLIYKEFIYDLHVLSDVPKGWLDYHLPPKDYTVRVAWDVHDAIPQAVLFAATAPTGEVFIYDEQFFDKLISPNAELLKEKVAGRFVPDYIIDPRAVIESPVTGESILDKLMDFDLWFEKGSKDMDLGISETREKLKERRPMKKSDGQDYEAPTIWFSPRCSQTLFEIMRYAYNPKTMRPIDKDDHMLENLRRLVLNGLNYIEPPKASDWAPRAPLRIRHNEDLQPLRR